MVLENIFGKYMQMSPPRSQVFHYNILEVNWYGKLLLWKYLALGSSGFYRPLLPMSVNYVLLFWERKLYTWSLFLLSFTSLSVTRSV